jgi:hypothetical protein
MGRAEATVAIVAEAPTLRLERVEGRAKLVVPIGDYRSPADRGQVSNPSRQADGGLNWDEAPSLRHRAHGQNRPDPYWWNMPDTGVFSIPAWAADQAV